MKLTKKIVVIILCFMLTACIKKRIVELPQIPYSNITKLNDVSPAYLFYDETQPDSVLLNRKNLIGNTHWIVGVDKRLRLRQAIPKIKFLQEKKRGPSLHEKTVSKNYFACNDSQLKNLGFIDFTNINYHLYESNNDRLSKKNKTLILRIQTPHNIVIRGKTIPLKNIQNTLKHVLDTLPEITHIRLEFYKNLSFQDYIDAKVALAAWPADKVRISPEECIVN